MKAKAAVLAYLVAAWGTTAYAMLGGTPTHHEPSTNVTRIFAQAGTATPIRVTETLLPSGTTVHEYATTDRTVFAITWRGSRMPDLRSLFGQRFDAYVNSVETSRLIGVSRDVVSVSPADMVVQAGGVPGAFRGLAYLPAQIPADVNPTELK